MTRNLLACALPLVILLSLGADDCGPTPTQATFTNQRKVPFFEVLAFEEIRPGVTIYLFEDEAGSCYITSGTDGGITELRSRTACDKAKVPDLEGTKAVPGATAPAPEGTKQ